MTISYLFLERQIYIKQSALTKVITLLKHVPNIAVKWLIARAALSLQKYAKLVLMGLKRLISITVLNKQPKEV